MHLSVVKDEPDKTLLNLNWYRHLVTKPFKERGLEERYDLGICASDNCVYAANRGDPDRKYLVGFASEFAAKKMHVVTSRLDWIARK